MADASLVALRDRVRVATEPGLASTRARVTVFSGARRLEAEADTGTPASDLTQQRRRLRSKFDALVTPVLGEHQTAQLAQAALAIDDAPAAAALLALTRPQ
jgi:hypothetical protein